jgi:hypothetical protein
MFEQVGPDPDLFLDPGLLKNLNMDPQSIVPYLQHFHITGLMTGNIHVSFLDSLWVLLVPD